MFTVEQGVLIYSILISLFLSYAFIKFLKKKRGVVKPFPLIVNTKYCVLGKRKEEINGSDS